MNEIRLARVNYFDKKRIFKNLKSYDLNYKFKQIQIFTSTSSSSFSFKNDERIII